MAYQRGQPETAGDMNPVRLCPITDNVDKFFIGQEGFFKQGAGYFDHIFTHNVDEGLRGIGHRVKGSGNFLTC